MSSDQPTVQAIIAAAEDDLPEIEICPEHAPIVDEYPFADTPDMKLRCFIFDSMGDADIDPKQLLQAFQLIFDWIKTGKVPADKPSHKPKLSAVPKE